MSSQIKILLYEQIHYIYAAIFPSEILILYDGLTVQILAKRKAENVTHAE